MEYAPSAPSIPELLSRFLRGEDVSLAAANRLEVALDEAFPNDPAVQDVVEVLASYRPGGGELLFDTPQVQRHLAKLSRYLGRE